MKTNWTNELASLETHKQKIERQIAYVRELIRLEEEHSTDMTSINHAFSQGKKKPRKNKNTAPPSQSVSGAKTMKLRWLREPNGIKDFTGQRTLDLDLSNIHSDIWMFNAKKGQPVGIEVYHAGASDMTIITRECKMWIA